MKNGLFLFLLFTSVTFAQDRLLPAESATLKGFVGERLDNSYRNRILAQDVARLVEPFKTRTEERCWQTEFWGKWFTSAVLAYRYQPTPQLKTVLDGAVSQLLATQTSDGYIGNYAEAKRFENWDIWGRKYSMLGLLAYHELTKDKRSLKAARRVADHLIRELTERKALIAFKGNHRGMAASSVLEPIALLYARTNDKKYLAFAEEIVRQWELPDGPQLLSKALDNVDVAKRFPKPKNWWSYEQGQKAYEMMSCYEGLLELYRITGKPQYRTAVEKVWENIRDTEINITGSGSSVECWFGGGKLQTLPAKHYQETCVTVTWIKLSQQLLRLTGEAKYADAVENAFYNALLGSMKPDGSTWAKYSPLAGVRQAGEEQCGMGLNCCEASGPRGLFAWPLTVVMQEKSGLSINFFAEGTYRLQTPGKQTAEVIQQTDYPVSGKVTIKIHLPKAEQMTIRVRIPAWSQQSDLSINGQPVNGLVAGQYAEINRLWQSSDEITLALDMRGRVLRAGDNAGFVAVRRGPLVLARDSRFGYPDVDETISPATDKDGFLPLEVVAESNFWISLKAPFAVGSYREGEAGKPVPLLFCDYASAGDAWNEKNRFRVWLPVLFDPEK
ncbi:MAG: glycoside hydrolase family 127 protein [Cytophagales bacterium]|nr:glycoside hydrolase family 127 protein [Cytophagales bacterium]